MLATNKKPFSHEFFSLKTINQASVSFTVFINLFYYNTFNKGCQEFTLYKTDTLSEKFAT